MSHHESHHHHPNRSFVVGVGMTKFEKAESARDYPDMAKEALTVCLQDAKLDYGKHVKAVVAGYCYGDPTCGQKAVYQMGLTGIPVFNVNNNCSTGSSALMLARNLVQSGQYDCVIALGFEKMQRNLSQLYTDNGWTSPVDKHFDTLFDFGTSKESLGKMNAMTGNVIKMFGEAAKEHQKRYGTTDRHYATIAYKNHLHSTNNPYARNQKNYSMSDIMDKNASLYGPLTLLQACPTGDGAAAAIVCSERFMRENQLEEQAVEIVAQEMITDLPSSFDSTTKSYIDLCGFQMCMLGAKKVYHTAGLTPQDVDVLEVHDCFSSNELMMYEALGLCNVGEGGKLVENGRWITNKENGSLFQLGERWVVNPSGGLESKGHPIGATGLAQCTELCWQLRGMAGKRQVENARVAMQHNFGLGSAAVITLYRKYEPNLKTITVKSEEDVAIRSKL